MSLQEAIIDRRRRRTLAFSGYTISASDLSVVVNGISAEHILCGDGQWLGGGSTSVGQGVTISYYSGSPEVMADDEYDPAFVAKILDVAAKPPEAKFNNVVDMLEWLNRD